MFFSVLSKPFYDSLTLLKDTHILEGTLFLSSFFPPSHPKILNSHTGQFFQEDTVYEYVYRKHSFQNLIFIA